MKAGEDDDREANVGVLIINVAGVLPHATDPHAVYSADRSADEVKLACPTTTPSVAAATSSTNNNPLPTHIIDSSTDTAPPTDKAEWTLWCRS
ncbi:hypothetical protein GUJ93_ZPchr0009g1956 [Zizania palustris]|uniref:Uncharacterized protein n=1 Tax=Zizania palustris TaxID=103762 RepID=A0A8J5UZ65_ZIZPA|nr:hypothetical protein GUJ93_ZPchr0009g1956 [Zizania palustris]